MLYVIFKCASESTWYVKILDSAGKATHPLFFLSARWGFPKVCMLLGGGELEEWKGCTFLPDGIRFPIGGAGAILENNPSFSKLK